MKFNELDWYLVIDEEGGGVSSPVWVDRLMSEDHINKCFYGEDYKYKIVKV